MDRSEFHSLPVNPGTYDMGEISTASSGQSIGVGQVGEVITQMDQVTQQNASLVEEMAAATESLISQAHDLVQTVSVFKLAHRESPATIRLEVGN